MNKLYVSSPVLGDFAEFTKLAAEVYDSKFLTNNGVKVRKLESELKHEFDIPYLSLVTNGTVALEIAIKSLDLEKGGEIITTPFSWIATSSSIIWSNYKPVFVDIDPDTFNIDPSLIEDKITAYTVAILGVHTFSNPCDVEEIKNISQKYNLNVIYDGAHSVGVNYKGKDLSQYGDVSTHSYHATKIFNTAEGGAVITTNKLHSDYINELRSFGLSKDQYIVSNGTNAKMHELTACVGLCNLPILRKSISYRKILTDTYMNELSNVVKFQQFNRDSYNYSYMPVIFETKEQLSVVLHKLNSLGIMARKYFYPSLDTLEIYDDIVTEICPNSLDISKRVMCLPCHDDITLDDVVDICNTIKNTLNIY